MPDPLRAAAEALKPCPFCGEEAVVSDSAPSPDGRTFYQACCLTGGCPGNGTSYLGRPHAIAAWNRRAALAAPEPSELPRELTDEQAAALWDAANRRNAAMDFAHGVRGVNSGRHDLAWEAQRELDEANDALLAVATSFLAPEPAPVAAEPSDEEVARELCTHDPESVGTNCQWCREAVAAVRAAEKRAGANHA